MNIIGVRKYEAAPHEQITFSFQRSRSNLPVSLSVDGGEFVPMPNEFALQVPADKGTERRVVIMIVGEDNDLCNLTISGQNGPPDQDALVVMSTPVCSARYRFTVL
jgi:hypothetical protein